MQTRLVLNKVDARRELDLRADEGREVRDHESILQRDVERCTADVISDKPKAEPVLTSTHLKLSRDLLLPVLALTDAAADVHERPADLGVALLLTLDDGVDVGAHASQVSPSCRERCLKLRQRRRCRRRGRGR